MKPFAHWNLALILISAPLSSRLSFPNSSLLGLMAALQRVQIKGSTNYASNCHFYKTKQIIKRVCLNMAFCKNRNRFRELNQRKALFALTQVFFRYKRLNVLSGSSDLLVHGSEASRVKKLKKGSGSPKGLMRSNELLLPVSPESL